MAPPHPLIYRVCRGGNQCQAMGPARGTGRIKTRSPTSLQGSHTRFNSTRSGFTGPLESGMRVRPFRRTRPLTRGPAMTQAAWAAPRPDLQGPAHPAPAPAPASPSGAAAPLQRRHLLLRGPPLGARSHHGDVTVPYQWSLAGHPSGLNPICAKLALPCLVRRIRLARGSRAACLQGLKARSDGVEMGDLRAPQSVEPVVRTRGSR